VTSTPVFLLKHHKEDAAFKIDGTSLGLWLPAGGSWCQASAPTRNFGKNKNWKKMEIYQIFT
jgi:hypothetical protein